MMFIGPWELIILAIISIPIIVVILAIVVLVIRKDQSSGKYKMSTNNKKD